VCGETLYCADTEYLYYMYVIRHHSRVYPEYLITKLNLNGNCIDYNEVKRIDNRVHIIHLLPRIKISKFKLFNAELKLKEFILII